MFVLLYTPAAVDNGSSLCLLFPFTPLTFLVLVFQQLALYVLSFLEPKDLLQAAQTCRYWRILAEDNLLWREKCREEGECKVSVTDVEGGQHAVTQWEQSGATAVLKVVVYLF